MSSKEIKKVDYWDEETIDVTNEANFIWSIANKLRGAYMPDKYGDVIIPMTIIRRFECALEKTKDKIVQQYKKNPNHPIKGMQRIAGFDFYNTSDFTLKELCNDSDHIKSNFKSYINGFSSNVQDILKELEMSRHIDKMDKEGCLFSVVKAFSELDLSIETFDSIKMGYIFENLIGRFYQNVDAGQYYTGRDIIKMIVSVLTAEGSDDIFEEGKVITVCDQACGTGGMLSTAYTYLKHFNPSSDVRLFGQELMGQSYAVGLAEMLIKGQNADNFKHADTFKEDCFRNTKMRFVIENPPFGTPWSGKDAKEGQEEAVKKEFQKGFDGRWGAGLPSGSDSQLLFMQSAIEKMDDNKGRAAIIENGSPLFTGGVSSGESQVRKWLLESDIIEAIIALPTELFYNTGLSTFVWILSKNKRNERKGKIQLIDARNIFHRLRKPLGLKKKELTKEDRKRIAKLYTDFKENKLCQIYKNSEFIYKEYTIMQPLQRSYAITKDRISNMIQTGSLSFLYDEKKVMQLENSTEQLSSKDEKKLKNFKKNKPAYEAIMKSIEKHIDKKIYYNYQDFFSHMENVLYGVVDDKKTIKKIVDGLSIMDKKAEIHKDKKGNVIYDKETKDTENVNVNEDIDMYMKREVTPHIPDAKAFFEEKLEVKKPIIKTGAEIPFTRYFYKYKDTESSDQLETMFSDSEKTVDDIIKKVFE